MKKSVKSSGRANRHRNPRNPQTMYKDKKIRYSCFQVGHRRTLREPTAEEKARRAAQVEMLKASLDATALADWAVFKGQDPDMRARLQAIADAARAKRSRQPSPGNVE